jgi:arylesterase/paraoxonase
LNSALSEPLQIGASVAVASTSAALYILHKYIYPFGKHNDPNLPQSWVPYRNDPAVDIAFKERLRYCEDVVIDHAKGMAIISCDPGRTRWNTVMGTMYDPSPKGSLYLYSYATKDEPKLVSLIGLPPTADFHPLGLNFYRSEVAGAQTRLFVVNHQRNGSTVDIFDLDYPTATATFITSICDGDRNIVSPNAVSPVSYTSFYVTNDHRFIQRLHPILNLQETMRALPLGWATFVDFSVGKPKFSTAATGIPFANGIVVTPTGKEVLIASSSSSVIFVYDRDPVTNKMSRCREKIPCKFRPDNLTFDESLRPNDPTTFDENGRFLRGVICAGHPSTMKLFAMSRNPGAVKAPSWVVEVRRRAGKTGEVGDAAPCPATEPNEEGSYWLKTLYQSKSCSSLLFWRFWLLSLT